ncbi:MAG TPA: NAD(P)-dependent oxidoreductase [Steroidobacteraceae bacterium]
MNIRDLRLLVTGASGFIGSRLALHLRRIGVDAEFAGRDTNDAERGRLRELSSSGIQVHLGDLRDADFVERVVAGRNAILHLAAAQHENEKSEEYFRSINLGATELLLEKARASGIRRFVYGSTIGVYGSSKHGTINDYTRTRPLNSYTRTKLAAEDAVLANARYFETSIVRIGETYGPGDFRLLKLYKAIDRNRFVMIGNGKNLRQPIFVEDLIRGLLATLTSKEAVGEIFPLVGSEPMSTREMVEHIAHALERPVPRLRVPLWPVLTAASVLNVPLRLIGIRSPLHPRSLDFFRKSFVFSTTKAKDLLGFEPATTKFADGARATLAWYRAQGYLPERTEPALSRTARI